MIVYLLLHVQRNRIGGRLTADYQRIFIGIRALHNIAISQVWQDL